MLTSYIEWAEQVALNLGFDVAANDVEFQVLLILLTITVLSSLLTALWRGILWYVRRQRQIKLSRDLNPFFASADIKHATEYYVPSHFQSNPPSQHQELMHAHKVTARQKLLPFFLNHAFKAENDQQRFYIVLAGSGMGKTTFMLNLYMAYLKRKQVGRASFNIKLMPLGYPDLLKRIDQIEDQENTILLLDGLDEDTQAIRNYRRRLERILNRVKDFRFVVFTSRTQFFPSEEEEPRETGVVKFGTKGGFQTFAKLYLSPFDEKDIQQYLIRRYGRWKHRKKEKALRIVELSPNLMVRPMLLGYIDDLMEADEGQYQYLSKLYEALISKWIEREAGRVPENRREKFAQELYRFSREVALNIYKQRRHRKGLYIGLKEIRKLGEQHDIELDEIEMQSRSLLNRNVMDQFKFAHKSILEYFLAREAVENPGFAARLNFQSMDQARIFYQEMCLLKRTYPMMKEGKIDIMVQMEGEADWKPSDQISFQELVKVIGFRSQQVDDLTIIAALPQLETVDLAHSGAEEIHSLAGMDSLAEIHLAHTRVADIGSLEDLPGLKVLDIGHTLVSDLSPLRKLVYLESLNLSHLHIKQFEPLQGLRLLRELDLSNTGIRDIGVVKGHEHLTRLSLAHCPIKGLNPLREFSQLTHLDLSYTQVRTISALKGLFQLNYLDLSGTQVQNFTPLKSLPLLRELKISLSADSENSLSSVQEMLPQCNITLVKLPATSST